MDEFTPIHRTVAERAAQTPDALAVTDGSATLTYRELIERADELAAHLVRRGLSPGGIVALHLQRSGALLVAMLAVSQAGGGSLMLDVDGPQRWLSRFVDIARPVAWVMHESAAPPPFAGDTFRLAADGSCVDPRDAEDAEDAVGVEFPEVGAEDLACLVQTSGTTGEPKLVMVPHRTWSYAAQTQQELHAITRDERGAWLFPSHTNVSVSVVVWPFLAAGALLSVPDEHLLAAPPELAGWIRDQGVTQFFAVAPLAEALARQDWPPSALRLMLTGSDRVREWGRPDLPFEIGNWYGANEVNIVTSSVVPWEQRITSATAGAVDRSGPPPIGRVWPGATWRVVDADDQPVSVGEVGELLVGGGQLAIGYHSPAKTAAKFVPDESRPGERIYRTGDLVRVRADGVFEHCGRVDEQLKINGVRVEMAEVEAALLTCPGVREAAAAAVEIDSGRARLVGYVVCDRSIDDVELREWLSDALPAHMVPVAYVRMDKLPRNRGDKIDRRALPAPAAGGGAGDDELSDQVASVLADVLRRDSCASDDNFFLLGGDSMLATRAARDLTKQLGREVSVRQVLLHPTPRELTDLIRQGG